MAPLAAPALPAVPPLPVDAVVFGEALLDLYADPTSGAQPGQPVQPVQIEDAERFVRHLGGAPCNLAVGLSRQGKKVALITLVGPDAHGRGVRKLLEREGVVTDGLGVHKSARTGITFVSLDGPHGRSFLFYRHPSADMLISAGELVPALVSRGRLFHFGSSTLSREPARAATLKALELATAKRARKLVSIDVNLRPHLWPEVKEAPPLLRKLFADCDIVKLTEEELLLLFGTEDVAAAAAQVRQKGPAVVVITRGARGAYLDCHAGQSYFAAEALPPPGLVDPTGAGDAFTAGLLSVLLDAIGPLEGPGPEDLRARLRGLPLEAVKRACQRGTHLGARACTALGATTAVPRVRS